jgi:DMSO/TMAO reductase YedYZ molybdopterin-dependent catalytic subunit
MGRVSLLIIPGYIGGRMVKWLNKIVVTSQESGNYYHFHDNRVLPSHVDAETAKAEGTCQPLLFTFGALGFRK